MATMFIKNKQNKVKFNGIVFDDTRFWAKIKKYLVSSYNNEIIYNSRKRYQKFLRRW